MVSDIHSLVFKLDIEPSLLDKDEAMSMLCLHASRYLLVMVGPSPSKFFILLFFTVLTVDN